MNQGRTVTIMRQEPCLRPFLWGVHRTCVGPVTLHISRSHEIGAQLTFVNTRMPWQEYMYRNGISELTEIATDMEVARSNVSFCLLQRVMACVVSWIFPVPTSCQPVD